MSELSGRPRPVRPAATRTVNPTERAVARPPAVSAQDAADVAVYAASVALAVTRSALGLAARGTRGTVGVLPVPAAVRHRLGSAWQTVLASGRQQRRAAIAEIETVADAVIPWAADAIVARIDFDQVIARVDLVGLSQYVVNGVDLPAIIRTSSESVTTEMVHGIRSSSADADEAVARAVDRVLRRRRSRRLASGAPNGASGSPPP